MAAVIELAYPEWHRIEGLFDPIAPLYRVENVFARLGRWRRLSPWYEGKESSTKAWLEVAALAYMFARLRTEPT